MNEKKVNTAKKRLERVVMSRHATSFNRVSINGNERCSEKKFSDIYRDLGYSSISVKRHVNYKTLEAGVQLGYLTVDDVYFMFKSSTTEDMAQRRLISRRRSSD